MDLPVDPLFFCVCVRIRNPVENTVLWLILLRLKLIFSLTGLATSLIHFLKVFASSKLLATKRGFLECNGYIVEVHGDRLSASVPLTIFLVN